VTVNLVIHEKVSEESRCVFPHLGEKGSFSYEELVYNTGHIKSGCHDPKGILLLYGAGVKPGSRIKKCDNFDITPTILSLLGLQTPKEMKGRVLSEAFGKSEAKSLMASA
jgi:hypothetical protein